MQYANTATKAPVHRGYIEGYYGKWLSWQDRSHIITHLSKLGFDSYLYAPKDDPSHRFNWRQPYDKGFISAFADCSKHAKQQNITFLAGIAPGLDFNFADPQADTTALLAKARQLHGGGAHGIVLMFDDISGDDQLFSSAGLEEGHCHGALANLLHAELSCPVMLVPRLYADEIEGDHDGYATQLAGVLNSDISVFICGKTIVAQQIALPDNAGILPRHLKSPAVIWDNLYCNDYCPRRLFTGPFEGRQSNDPIMLNGTGLVKTDEILLSLMSGEDRKTVLQKAGVPGAFDRLSAFFWHPVFSSMPTDQTRTEPLSDLHVSDLIEHIDQLLWQWKSDLAREWYPYLFGLKQDLMMAHGLCDTERINKTQTAPLARLLRGKK